MAPFKTGIDEDLRQTLAYSLRLYLHGAGYHQRGHLGRTAAHDRSRGAQIFDA